MDDEYEKQMLDDQSFVDLTLRMGLLDRQTLEDVALHAQRSGRTLLETAVELRAVEEWPVIEAAGAMLGVETVHLAARHIPEHIGEIVPFQEARRLGVLPFEEVGSGPDRTLRIAMIDPMDFDALEALGQWVSIGMEPVLVGPEDLQQTLRRLAAPAPARPTSQTGSGMIPLARVTIGRMQRPASEASDEEHNPGHVAGRSTTASGNYEVAATGALYEEPASASVAWSARQALPDATSPLSTTPPVLDLELPSEPAAPPPRPMVSSLPQAQPSTPTSDNLRATPGESFDRQVTAVAPQEKAPTPQEKAPTPQEDDLFDFGGAFFEEAAPTQEPTPSTSSDDAPGQHTPSESTGEDLLSFDALDFGEPATTRVNTPDPASASPPVTATAPATIPNASQASTDAGDEDPSIDRATYDTPETDSGDDEGFAIDRATYDTPETDSGDDEGFAIDRASYADAAFVIESNEADDEPSPQGGTADEVSAEDASSEDTGLELAGFFAEDAGFEAEAVRDEPAWSASASVVSSRKARTDAFFEDEPSVSTEAQSQAAQPLFERRATPDNKPRRAIPPPPPSARRPQTGALPGVAGARVTSAQPGVLQRPSTMVAPALPKTPPTQDDSRASLHSALTSPGSADAAPGPWPPNAPSVPQTAAPPAHGIAEEEMSEHLSTAPPGRSIATSGADSEDDAFFPRVHSFVESGLHAVDVEGRAEHSGPLESPPETDPLDFDFDAAHDAAPVPPPAPSRPAPPRRTGTFKKLDPSQIPEAPAEATDPLEEAIRQAPSEALIALVHQLVEIGMLDRDSLLKALQGR